MISSPRSRVPEFKQYMPIQFQSAKHTEGPGASALFCIITQNDSHLSKQFNLNSSHELLVEFFGICDMYY